MNVLQVIPSLRPSGGGPIRTVIGLADALAEYPHTEIDLLSQCRTGQRCIASGSERVTTTIKCSTSSVALRLGLPIRNELCHRFKHRKPDILHSHGIWLPANHWCSRASRKYKTPLVIHPRGMLEPWSLNHHAYKKKVALYLYQLEDLRSASVLVATSDEESENIRRLGITHPIAVIPNGIKMPSSEHGEHITRKDQKKVALFISRIHPKKGLTNLIRAWSELKPTNWLLKIAGPDEGGHIDEVLSLISNRGLTNSISYVGEVDGKEKQELYRSASFFVLPTYSENFGVVVAEALSYGVPVITTTGAPWEDLLKYRCGWWIDTGVAPLVHALREAFATQDEELRAMGLRGREYVNRYNWHDIAGHMLDVYQWILNKGPKPDCIRQ